MLSPEWERKIEERAAKLINESREHFRNFAKGRAEQGHYYTEAHQVFELWMCQKLAAVQILLEQQEEQIRKLNGDL